MNINKILKGDDRKFRFVRPTICVDLDGTLCKFREMNEPYVDAKGQNRFFHMEDLYERGYFENLPAHENVKKAVQALDRKARKNKSFDVVIFSSYLSDSNFAAKEKIDWVIENLGSEYSVYLMPCGCPKNMYISDKSAPAVLVDDYSYNLMDWENIAPGFKGIKMITGINNTHGSWIRKHPDNIVRHSDSPKDIAGKIYSTLKEAILERQDSQSIDKIL